MKSFMKLTVRQVARYTRNNTLEAKLQEVEEFNKIQRKVIDNMANISDKRASDFMNKNRFGNVTGIKTIDDAKYYLSFQEVQDV